MLTHTLVTGKLTSTILNAPSMTPLTLSKKLPHAPPSKNTQLWEAVKLVNAIDNQDPDIHSKFTHIPDYLALANDPDKLVAPQENIAK